MRLMMNSSDCGQMAVEKSGGAPAVWSLETIGTGVKHSSALSVTWILDRDIFYIMNNCHVADLIVH